MSKFKIGDKVRITRNTRGWNKDRIPSAGKEFTLSHQTGVWDGEESWGVTDPDCYYRYKESEMELVVGPVRTKTVTEIVDGDYGKVHVSTYDETRARIGIDSIMNAKELTDAIATLTAIRDALQEQDK